MLRNFVFRNREGRLCGYLVQTDGRLSCRLYDDVSGVNVVTAAQDGSIRHFRVGDTAREYTWECGESPVEAAYVQRGEAMIMDSGVKARELYRRIAAESAHCDRHKPIQAEQPECRADLTVQERTDREPALCAPAISQGGERENAGAGMERREYPQRRWPPPVMMRAPVYVSGRWIDESD